MRLLNRLFMGPRSVLTGKRRPWTGDELRAIRAVKGVGRPPRTAMPVSTTEWARVFQARCTNAMAMGARVFGGMRLQYVAVPNGLRHPTRVRG